MEYKDFLDLKYTPNKNDLICVFKIKPTKGISMKEAASRVASESSNGTWTDLPVTNRIRKLSAKVYSMKKDIIKVAYPIDLFEYDNMPQILSSIAGNIFGMKAVVGLRLEDVFFPKKIINSYKGPQFGVNGVKKIFKVKKRPLSGTVPKPKVGYTSKQHAKVGYDIWTGGLDLLKDDENLSSQKFNPFKKRVVETIKVRDKAEQETGERKSQLLNVTAETEKMLERAEFVKEQGGEYVMIDILTAGWSSVQTLRKKCDELKLAIHAHRAFHAAFDRNPNHGMSMMVIAKIARLIGVDQIHIGALGKLAGTKKEVMDLYNAMTKNKFSNFGLEQNWSKIKPILPVCSGGLHPAIIPRLLKTMGNDMMLQAGGGVIGHPDGIKAGAKAVRQVIDSTITGVPLNKAAKIYPELNKALKFWGNKAKI